MFLWLPTLLGFWKLVPHFSFKPAVLAKFWVKGTLPRSAPTPQSRHLCSSLGLEPGVAASLHFLPLGSYSPHIIHPAQKYGSPGGGWAERYQRVASGLRLSACTESAAGLLSEVTGFLGPHLETHLVEEVLLSARIWLEDTRSHTLRNRVWNGQKPGLQSQTCLIPTATWSPAGYLTSEKERVNHEDSVS